MFFVAVLSVIACAQAQVKLGMTRIQRSQPLGADRRSLRTDSMKLKDFLDLAYTVQINVTGTVMSVIPDTGSEVLWVPTEESIKRLGKCHNIPHFMCYPHVGLDKFSPNLGKFDLEYGSGAVSCYVTRGTVSLGEGLELGNFTYGAAYDLSGMGRMYPYDPFDGIMGLAWRDLSSEGEPKVDSTILTLAKAGKIDSAQFSFYLGPRGGDDAEIHLGTPDKAYFTGDLTYIPLEHELWWQVKLTSVRVKSKEMLPPSEEATATQRTAIVDSGTSLLIVSPSIGRGLIDTFNAHRQQDGSLVAECSNVSGITIGLGSDGMEFSLEAADIILGQDGSTCLLGIDVSDMDDIDAVLGDTFMRKYYSNFNYEKKAVGLAPAKVPN